MNQELVAPFEQRAVAFVDILGFKSFVAEAQHQTSKVAQLFALRTVLEGHAKWDNRFLAENVPDEVRPEYLVVSDSIILSAPIGVAAYDGLGIVVAKSIQLGHKLLDLGHLVRGAIEIGPVWHKSGNIFGTGYNEAYKLEGEAKHPRVILGPRARQQWEASPLRTGPMCREDNGVLVINSFLPDYIIGNGQAGMIEVAYERYRACILMRLDALDDQQARSKWEWMANEFNNAVKRHGVNVKPI